MLCSTCRSIIVTTDWTSLSDVACYNPHHENLVALTNAAVHDCNICSAVLRGLTSYNPAASKLPYSFTYAVYGFSEHQLTQLQIKANFGDPYAVYSHHFLLHPLDLVAGYLPSDTVPSQSQPGTDGIRVADRTRGVKTHAARWLRQCLQNHPGCNLTTPKSPPRRLLKLQPDNVRLIETSDLPTMPGYASLSHCWGRSPSFETLTSDNFDAMTRSIPPDTTAQSFRDAIEVCRLLQIEYMWIDSLCIIQKGDGYDEDWRYHVGAMGGIYAGAIINICATRATSSNEGFLQLRPALRDASCVTLPGISRQATCQIIDLEAASVDLARSPTSRRAWIFQERILSPRVLHFTGNELYWECSTQRLACESFPDGVPHADLQFRSNIAPFNPTHAYRMEEDTSLSDGHQSVLSAWYSALEDYTRRQISFPEKDKFVALAGVTKEFERLLNDRCIAGMFVSDLALALLWDPSSSCAPVNPDRPYRAPSWSWASVDGGVSYQHALLLGARRHELAIHIDVLSAVATPADTASPLGQLVSAQLVVSGYAVTADWVYDAEEQYMDVNLSKDGSDATSIHPVLGQLDDTVQHGTSPAGAVAFLVVTLADPSDCAAWGLLLSPDPQSTFRRVGFWWTYQDHVKIVESIRSQSKIHLTVI